MAVRVKVSQVLYFLCKYVYTVDGSYKVKHCHLFAELNNFTDLVVAEVNVCCTLVGDSQCPIHISLIIIVDWCWRQNIEHIKVRGTVANEEEFCHTFA